MTNIITSYFNHSELAVAAYANNLFPGIEPQDYIDVLVDVGFSSVQAQIFAGIDENGGYIIDEGFEVVHHQANTDSGFSATVFRNRATGELIFSMRGTEFELSLDAIDDLFLADFGNIGLDGIAIQIRGQVLNFEFYVVNGLKHEYRCHSLYL